jgi:hypothetical protein
LKVTLVADADWPGGGGGAGAIFHHAPVGVVHPCEGVGPIICHPAGGASSQNQFGGGRPVPSIVVYQWRMVLGDV